MKTRYVFVVDASVEFTHNTNLPRMKSMLDSQQVRAVSPMLENAATSELSGQCFDVVVEGMAHGSRFAITRTSCEFGEDMQACLVGIMCSASEGLRIS